MNLYADLASEYVAACRAAVFHSLSYSPGET